MGELGPFRVGFTLIALLFFLVGWVPPPEWFQVNFNGSIFSSVRRGGAGFVVRDHDSKLILAANFPLLNVSIPLAEMITAWHVMKAVVFRIGVTKL